MGREKELRRLDDAWAAGETVNVFSLVAFGGVGKSALVQAWLDRLQARGWDGAERVFGWSFYSQGSREATESADPFFEAIFPWLGQGEPPTEPEEKGETLAALLTRGRTLLILDGLEPLQLADGRVQDRALAALLRSLLYHNPGLCLITTRVAVADLADRAGSTAPRIDLEQLGPQAGVALLKRYGVKGLESELQAAVKTLGGHALALTLAGTYLREYEKGEIGKLAEIEWLDDDIPEGDHALRMLSAYETQLGEAERSILRLLGLFDRPAPEGALATLRQEPPIPGLTEGLDLGNDRPWQRALARLRQLHLIVEEEDRVRAQTTLDAHPLVREYFGGRLRQNHPDAWQRANDRLYQWYQAQAPDQPDTLEEMLPLYRAVVHGCRAGKHQEALEELYWRRIQRGNEGYSWKKLGAFSSELVAQAAFFERPWGRPAPELTPADQAFLLNQAAFTLRAVGRLREAVEPLRLVTEKTVELGDFKNAAVDASNLAELLLTLGDVTEAVVAGRRAVELAEESGDAFQRMGKRTTLATALHQSAPAGSPSADEAASLFTEAEALQKEFQPTYPYLYSLPGYRYCELLLGDTPNREAAEGVRERAQAALEIDEINYHLLSIALDHLILGRAAFDLARLEKEDFVVAAQELDVAVAGLRQAGQVDYLARGLLARARLYRELKEWDRAARDLEEVRSIAERGSMRLHLADYHLDAAELARGRGEGESAVDHAEKARELIEATGYGRRLPHPPPAPPAPSPQSESVDTPRNNPPEDQASAPDHQSPG